MPLFDYHCTNCGSTREVLVSVPAPDIVRCDCGADSERRPAVPNFTLQWARPPIDNVKEVWGDTTDGVNESQYKSTKAFF